MGVLSKCKKSRKQTQYDSLKNVSIYGHTPTFPHPTTTPTAQTKRFCPGTYTKKCCEVTVYYFLHWRKFYCRQFVFCQIDHFDQIISCAQEAGEAADQDAKLVQAGDKKFKIARAKEKEFREGLEHTSSLLGYPSKILEIQTKTSGSSRTRADSQASRWGCLEWVLSTLKRVVRNYTFGVCLASTCSIHGSQFY